MPLRKDWELWVNHTHWKGFKLGQICIHCGNEPAVECCRCGACICPSHSYGPGDACACYNYKTPTALKDPYQQLLKYACDRRTKLNEIAEVGEQLEMFIGDD